MRMYLQFFFLASVLAARAQPFLDAKTIVKSPKQGGVGLNLVHVNAARSPFRLSAPLTDDTLKYAQMLLHTHRNGSPTSTLGQTSGEYYTTVKLGSNLEDALLIIDTGSELTWVQCVPCKGCAPTVGPVYDSSSSSSYKVIPCTSSVCANSSRGTYAFCDKNLCTFATFYADGSFSYGNLSLDTLSLQATAAGTENVVIRDFKFGCAGLDYERVPTGASGLLGLNFGKMGFAMQLGEAYSRKFSTCFPDKLWHLNSSGVIYFGEAGVSEPLLSFSQMIPSNAAFPFYFITVKGISIDQQRLRIAENLFQKTMMDSGTSFTILVPQVYKEIRANFLKRMQALGYKLLQDFSFAGLDTCFEVPKFTFNWSTAPAMSLDFGRGSKVQLPAASIFLPVPSNQRALLRLCFAFQSGNANVIGNYQHQNLWIEYDIEASRVGFAQAHCAID